MVVGWRRWLRLTDGYYARLSPKELQRELWRHEGGMSFKTAKRWMLVWVVLLIVGPVLQLASVVLGWSDQGIMFSPLNLNGWMWLVYILGTLRVGYADWSNLSLMHHWQQKLGRM
jgi:hypothetical protein